MHNCKEFTEIHTIEGIVCSECGLFLSPNIDSKPVFGEYHETIISKSDQSKLTLQKYITNVLTMLKLPKIIHEKVGIIAYDLIRKMYLYTNFKGSYLKKSLVIVCVYNLYNVYSYSELINTIDLNIKYISKAENVIANLISINRVKQDLFQDNNHPIRVIYNVIHTHQLKIPDCIMNDTNSLIDECLKLKFTSHHQPSSIAISCLFYIIRHYKIDMDIKLFSDIYNLSMATILKISDKINTQIKQN